MHEIIHSKCFSLIRLFIPHLASSFRLLSLCLSIFQLTFASINFVSRPPACSAEVAEEARVCVGKWSKQTKAEYRRMMNGASIVCSSLQSLPLAASRCPSMRSRLRAPGARSSPAVRAPTFADSFRSPRLCPALDAAQARRAFVTEYEKCTREWS